jgi:hypothetical protein
MYSQYVKNWLTDPAKRIFFWKADSRWSVQLMYVYDWTRGFICLLTTANSSILSTPLYDFHCLFPPIYSVVARISQSGGGRLGLDEPAYSGDRQIFWTHPGMLRNPPTLLYNVLALRNSPGEGSSHLLHGRSLKYRVWCPVRNEQENYRDQDRFYSPFGRAWCSTGSICDY